ncbi:Tat twin-arginine translocation pathway signal sequence protein [Nitzschia inconspicua]|uniref:Tat twin-arginine translocation pathway signal sequence protein n=1 Tax=Nitzschia inconspicua TaxID=303405 RepID=A0A9K3PLM5_9STRA|nr:Tat twin-arginine translocation pathway signal sequence protein [Nitzschia inconspicua]
MTPSFIRNAVLLILGVTLLRHNNQVDGLSTKPTTRSRRNFLQHQIATAAVAVLGVGSSFVQSASAYERRDVGDDKSRSAITAAFNEQAYLTNNRLEKEGFKLDTREEEQAKLSAAMASFSYESSNMPKKKTGFAAGSSSAAATSSTPMQK